MHDLLPNASIAITGTTARDFMDRIADLVCKSDIFLAHKNYDSDPIGDMDILSIHLKENRDHEELFGQIIHTTDYGDRVRIEVRANRWHPEGKPSYQTYVDAINFVFRDLLSEYNKSFGARYRLNIQGQEATEPKLSPKAQILFNAFVAAANKNGLHSLDWERYYRFVRVCHVFNTKTNEEDVFRLLVQSGFHEEYARELASVYFHLRQFQRYT